MQRGSLHDYLFRSDDLNARSHQRDRPVGQQIDAGFTAGNSNHSARVHQVTCANVQVGGGSNVNCISAAHVQAAKAANLGGLRQSDVIGCRSAHRAAEHASDGCRVVDANGLAVGQGHCVQLGALGQPHHVALGLHIEFLAAGLVLEAESVVVFPSAFKAASHDTALGGFGRKVPWRTRHAVVQAAQDDGAVRVAVHEADHDFLSDARDIHPTKVRSCPGLVDAHPAGIGRVVARVPVPQKAHFDAAELVRPHLLAFRPDDQGRLRAVDHRFGRHPGHAEDFVRRLHFHFVGAFVQHAAARLLGNFGQRQVRGQHQVLAVCLLVQVIRQVEGLAGGQPADIAKAARSHTTRAPFFHPYPANQRAMFGIGIVARPFEDLSFGPTGFPGLVAGRHQLHARPREVEVVDHHAAWKQPLIHAELPEDVAVQAAALRVHRNILIGLAVRRTMRANVVAQHQTMRAFGVLEEPVDSPFLHQPLHEVEIRFSVLHLKIARLIRVAFRQDRVLLDVQPLFHGIGIIFEHVVDDLHHVLILEDLVVTGQRRQPKPRPQRNAVKIVIAFLSHEPCLHHQARDFARASVRQLDRRRQLFTDHARQIQVGGHRKRHLRVVGRAQDDVIGEQFAHALLTFQRLKAQHGLAHGGRQASTLDFDRAGLI